MRILAYTRAWRPHGVGCGSQGCLPISSELIVPLVSLFFCVFLWSPSLFSNMATLSSASPGLSPLAKIQFCHYLRFWGMESLPILKSLGDLLGACPVIPPQPFWSSSDREPDRNAPVTGNSSLKNLLLLLVAIFVCVGVCVTMDCPEGHVHVRQVLYH